MPKPTERIHAARTAELLRFRRECQKGVPVKEFPKHVRDLVTKAQKILPSNQYDLVHMLAVRDVKFLADCKTYLAARTLFETFVNKRVRLGYTI